MKRILCLILAVVCICSVTAVSVGAKATGANIAYWASEFAKSTYVYRHAKDFISSERDFYSASDRLVATSVRYSAADTSFPMGAVGQQWYYMQNSSKWKRMPNVKKEYSLARYDIRPGDIFIRSDKAHTFVVTKKISYNRYQIAVASYCDYYPKFLYLTDTCNYTNKWSWYAFRLK